MKLNPHILTSTIALLTCAAFAADPAAPATESSATSTTVTSNGGKATITIDVNGKKETREIEIGKGVEIEAGTPPKLNVPATSIKSVKTITRGTWMGVAADELSEELRAQLPVESGAGLIVRTVIPDSPAAAANLQKNDVLLKLDDQLLTNPQQLRTLVGAKKDGDTVKVTYLRRGQQSTTEVKLAMHEDREIASEVPGLSYIPKIEKLFQNQARALVLDKSGKVIGNDQANLEATVEKIAKALRGVGADERSVEEATRALKETTKAISEAVRDAVVAKDEAMKGSGEIAKALEQVRDALEKVRQQTEEAVKKDRESRRDLNER